VTAAGKIAAGPADGVICRPAAVERRDSDVLALVHMIGLVANGCPIRGSVVVTVRAEH